MKLKEDLLFFKNPQEIRKAALQAGVEEGTPAETAQKLAEKMLSPEYMKKKFSILHEEDIRYFRIAARQKKRPAAANYRSADRLMNMNYGFITDTEGNFEIPQDVYEAFGKIDTPAFEEERVKYSWTSDCLYLAEYFYAVISREDFCRFYRVNRKRREEDQKILHMADDLIRDHLCRVHQEKDDFVKNGIEDEQLKRLQKIHAGYPFVLPPYSLMKDILEYSWPGHDPRWNTLRKYCLQELYVSVDFVDGLLEGIWMNITAGASYDQVLAMMKEENVRISAEQQTDLQVLLTDCWLHTSMSICNGGTPYASGLNPQIFLINQA